MIQHSGLVFSNRAHCSETYFSFRSSSSGHRQPTAPPTLLIVCTCECVFVCAYRILHAHSSEHGALVFTDNGACVRVCECVGLTP